ncbi:S41 family peptidase [uncultured Gilvimarinus sp.]|uniref:S41 family peptidase n=1 Tax=uncultured Gilvimarinus sp. TaxID=1689143 RepID=UPI0030DD83BD
MSAPTATFTVAAAERELAYLDKFFRENDAGAPTRLTEKGTAYFDNALLKAKKQLQQAGTWSECCPIYYRYLEHFRVNHMGLQLPAHLQQATPDSEFSAREHTDESPSAEALSEQTLLLRLPSFEDHYKEPLAQLLHAHRSLLQQCNNWIIDMRYNAGGSDHNYDSLLPWLVADETVSIGTQWLATADNIKCREFVKDMLQRNGGNEEIVAYLETAVTRMKQAAPGTFVNPEPEAVHFERVTPEPQRPDRVAILIGPECYSSGEQFLLTVRQSFSVKLVGQPTGGALDYSNLAFHELPESGITLWYAISRSNRLPQYPVDNTGVLPDIYLPTDQDTSDDQVARVQRWLEGGSLGPL